MVVAPARLERGSRLAAEVAVAAVAAVAEVVEVLACLQCRQECRRGDKFGSDGTQERNGVNVNTRH